MEGPPIARPILVRLGLQQAQIDEVCEIIAHHHSPGKITTGNFGVLYDADWLVNLGDEFDIGERDRLARIIDRVFITRAGRARARDLYLEDGTPS